MTRLNRSVVAACLLSLTTATACLLSLTTATACLLSLTTATVQAGEIKVYDRVPSIEELGAVLGGTPPTTQKKVKFRKLELGDDAAPSSPAEPATAQPQAPISQASVDAVSFPINFGYGSAQILPESRAYADVVGQLMNQRPELRFVVEGHTDAAGSDEYNFSLSEQRAAAVRGYLINRYRIDPSRLQPTGMGKSSPLPGEDPFSPRNRRVQFRPLG